MDEIQAQLPEEPNSFIGREREIAEVGRILRRARALTLCGPGGIGKTRLALRVLAATADEFPDGAWFVELADLRQPELVASRVAAVIGVSEEPGRPLLDTLADALRPRRLLLALDNCEHLIDACAQLGQRLLASSPGLRLLSTSREPLRIAAETAWEVPPLAVAPDGAERLAKDAHRFEAIRLFADRAAASRPGFTLGPGNAADVAAICRALDGMPLAIELAAARVRVLSAEQISARMGDRLELLTTGDRSAPARQQTLRAAIEWSYELLTPRSGSCSAGCPSSPDGRWRWPSRCAPTTDIPAPDVLDLLTALVDKSLVALEPAVMGEARYRMLDTIREYAAARLDEAGESARFRLALRDYAVRIAERNGAIGMARVPATWSARVDALRQYDVEARNVIQVLTWCVAQGDAETGLRMCAAVSPCWIVWGTFAEGREWLDSFLALDSPAVPAGLRGAATVVHAQLTLPSDRIAAETLARAGLELCRAAGDQYWTASALNLLSRDRPAHGADRGGGAHRGAGAVDRAGRR